MNDNLAEAAETNAGAAADPEQVRIQIEVQR